LVSTIVISDETDLGRVDAAWPSLLRRSSEQEIKVEARSIEPDARAPIERGLNRALSECGCHEGAIGVLGFSFVAALALRRGSGSRLWRRPVATMWHLTSRTAGAAVLGGTIGKLFGLAAARYRFVRYRRQLGELMGGPMT
jgi:hypothetical protein